MTAPSVSQCPQLNSNQLNLTDHNGMFFSSIHSIAIEGNMFVHFRIAPSPHAESNPLLINSFDEFSRDSKMVNLHLNVLYHSFSFPPLSKPYQFNPCFNPLPTNPPTPIHLILFSYFFSRAAPFSAVPVQSM